MITHIVRPKTLAEAVRAGSAPGAAWLGGGTWLNSRRVTAGDEAASVITLVSLEHLGLDVIRAESGRCVVGAMVTFQGIVDDPSVPSALREAAALTASRTLRNMVTLGGELGLAPRDSAVIPTLIALGAEVSVAGRRKPLPMQVYLDENKAGLVLEVSVPVQRAAVVRAVSRTSHSQRSLVVAVFGTRVVVSDCQGQVVVLPPGGAFDPRPDIHASAAYKKYMIGVLVEDLRAAAAREAAR